MRPDLTHLANSTRRHFLQSSGLGVGAMALSSILSDEGYAAPAPASETADPLAPRAPHFPAKAKRVVYLHMTGSPPNLDIWDWKPELAKRTG
jgi:hypothetical protein